MRKGYLAIVLHAHLPFVRHPEHDEFLQENWLFEAISDTYVPLLKTFGGLRSRGVDFRITVSLSPTLINMLKDELLIERYLRHLDKTISLAEKELERTSRDPELSKLAGMYRDRYVGTKRYFIEEADRDLIKEFGNFFKTGQVELITCCATHGYLPLMEVVPSAVKAQIKVAVETFEETFNERPKGFWLPECAYYPGHDNYLAEEGIEYFFIETHGLTLGEPRPVMGAYSPYKCESGVAVFGRDEESSKSVWSAEEGYPGDHNYREYYRDIGFDLDMDYIAPYINSCGSRTNTGIKYYRITGDSEAKELYDREKALKTASLHAKDFIDKRLQQVSDAHEHMKRDPIVTCPYDAELFGHWWFEGPEWIKALFFKLHSEQEKIVAVTPSEYLKKYGDYPPIRPAQSSWGYKGYHEVWLDGSNNWIYPYLHKVARLMEQVARANKDAEGIKKRALDQMSRELLLAQASDWAFIMKTGTFPEYAAERTKEHVSNFMSLYDQIENEHIEREKLEEMESKDNIFGNMDFEVYV